MTTARHTIQGGPYDGTPLQVRGERVAWSPPHIEGWGPAPLRALARAYAVGEGPWPWLLEHGIRRPSPSGRSGASVPHAQRHTVQVTLTLPPEVAEALRAAAARAGQTVSGYVAGLIR